jgi:hypothetical protein
VYKEVNPFTFPTNHLSGIWIGWRITNILSSDNQVLASIHLTVIPHLSNPTMLWWANLPKLLSFLYMWLSFNKRLLMFHRTLQRLFNKIVRHWGCCQCDGS